MRALLDTHILIWLMEDDPRLSADGRQRIVGAEELFVSSASIWEIAIKVGIGKMRIDVERLLLRMAQTDIHELPVANRHAKAVASLPRLHRDPFDRLLVAQAMVESMHMLTADPHLAAYSALVVTI
ncbi:MAG: type II toxin-antitoxin system VapC family toxin [Terracidiphilus sp.]